MVALPVFTLRAFATLRGLWNVGWSKNTEKIGLGHDQNFNSDRVRDILIFRYSYPCQREGCPGLDIWGSVEGQSVDKSSNNGNDATNMQNQPEIFSTTTLLPETSKHFVDWGRCEVKARCKILVNLYLRTRGIFNSRRANKHRVSIRSFGTTDSLTKFQTCCRYALQVRVDVNLKIFSPTWPRTNDLVISSLFEQMAHSWHENGSDPSGGVTWPSSSFRRSSVALLSRMWVITKLL